MGGITIIKRVNYMYKCSNCGSDNGPPSYSIRVQTSGLQADGFDLCPECAILISSAIREAGERMCCYRGIDFTAIDNGYEEYHSMKNSI